MSRRRRTRKDEDEEEDDEEEDEEEADEGEEALLARPLGDPVFESCSVTERDASNCPMQPSHRPWPSRRNFATPACLRVSHDVAH